MQDWEENHERIHVLKSAWDHHQASKSGDHEAHLQLLMHKRAYG